MKNSFASVRCALMLVIIGLGCGLFAPPKSFAADADTSIPTVVTNGFNAWAAKDASYAFDIWKIGGLLENDSKPRRLSDYFSRLDRTLGKIKSFELVESRRVGKTSRIIYVTLNFEHAVIYGRFLLYKTDKDWVVQNLDFSPKPEAVMPWLAFAGEDYTQ